MESLALKAAISFCLVAGHASAFAQDDELKIPPVKIPLLPPAAANAKGFAPAGWTVQREATGDLNGDGKPDIAFVLQDTDKRNILKTHIGDSEIDTNPRILGIAFAAANGTYTLAAQNSTFIARYDNPFQSDLFGEEGGDLTIKRGTVQISLYYFANAGGWDTGTNTFTFRWQNKHFELIGFENQNHNRGSGGDSSSSVNYSTGIAITSKTANENARPRNRTIHLGNKPLKTLDDIGDGMAFEYPGEG